MAGATPIAVKVEDRTGAATRGEVLLRVWSARERTRRAAKAWAIAWGIGAFTVLFPIIHFVLPPILLFVGPALALLLSRQESAVLGGTAKCPACGSRVEIVRSNYLAPQDRWPIEDSCDGCRTELRISRADSACGGSL